MELVSKHAHVLDESNYDRPPGHNLHLSDGDVIHNDVTILNVALGAHQGLSNEILIAIFQFTCCEGRPLLPIVRTQSPWVLGQVCSRWRQLSRAMPDMWGVKTISTRAHQDYAASIRQLQCATQVLPLEVCTIILHIDLDYLIVKAVTPYLNHVHHLYIGGYTQQGRSLELLPPGSLGKIEKLQIDYTVGTEPIEEHALQVCGQVFGPSPLLKELIFLSHSPDVLLRLDFPWSRIRNLKIDSGKDKSMVGAWELVCRSNPFQYMENLEVLSLCILDHIVFLLTAGIPWHKLLSLDIKYRGTPHHLPVVMDVLMKCESLQTLSLGLDESMDDSTSARHFHEVVRDTIDLPLPTHRSILPFKNLTNLRDLTFQLHDFYVFVAQCPNLEFLDCNIAGLGLPRPHPPNLVLEQLDYLWLRLDSPACFPTFFAPSVKSLYTSGYHDAQQIIDFTSRSDLTLDSFWWECNSEVEPTLDVATWHKLQAVTALCSYVKLTVTLPEFLLEGIGSGDVFRYADQLDIKVSNGIRALEMIKNRLEIKQRGDLVRLKEVCFGYDPLHYYWGEEDDNTMEELSQRYGVYLWSCLF